MEKFIVDTSVILNGKILELINEEELGIKPIILISRIVTAEIEFQANVGKVIGKYGLDVLKKLREYHNKGKIKLELVGKRPTMEQIKLNYGGELDAAIRQDTHDATLITGDKVQYDMGIFEGLNVILIKEEVKKKKKGLPHLKLFDFFDENTMSVHLKRYITPYAKKGSPGNWYLSKINDEYITSKQIEDIIYEILEAVKEDPRSFIEIEKKGGATVAILYEYRIVITRPPFSNEVEVTITKPLIKKTIQEYNLDNKLIKRLQRESEGILISGRPGAGKSTFAAALSNYYLKQNKIVKTLESVRDLQVSPEITQYTKLEGSLENSADILLLTRPDFTIFDEVRTTDDFKVYSDFRLSGVGMVGVVHSSSAIDALQRFISRIELGMLPSIIDTIIFIKGGEVSSVLVIQMTVKVPSGFRDKDLARPVVEVRNFLSKKLMFEIYSFGQDVVINPISKQDSGIYQTGGRTRKGKKKERILIDLEILDDSIIISADEIYGGKNVNIYSGSRIIFTGCFSRKGNITLSLDNRDAQILLDGIDNDKNLYARLK